MKKQNDVLEDSLVANKEFERLRIEAEAAENKDASGVLLRMFMEHMDKTKKDGEAAANKWFRDQVEGKTLKDLVAANGAIPGE